MEKKALRYIAMGEGISLILLLFVAMPLKYIWNWPAAVQVVGMAHGLLFIAYVFMLLLVGIPAKWSYKVLVICFIASFLPFGTFYVDKRYFRE